MATLKDTGFYIQAYRDAADQRVLGGDVPVITAEPVNVDSAVEQSIAMLSDRRARFPTPGMVEQARVDVFPDKSVPRSWAFGDAVSVLAQDGSLVAIISGGRTALARGGACHDGIRAGP